MKRINNYRFQQQQQKRQEYKKVKQIKKKFDDLPVDATEELEYIKKLLNGEDVGKYGPEEPEVAQPDDYFGWVTSGPIGFSSKGSRTTHMSMGSLPPGMSLSDVLNALSPKKTKS